MHRRLMTLFPAILLLASGSWAASQEAEDQETLKINSGAEYTKERSINLTLKDPDRIPPVVHMSLSSDGKTWGGWIAFKSSSEYELSGGDGKKTVFIRLRDTEGNEVLVASATILLDTIPPVAEVEVVPEVRKNEVVLLSNAEDAVAMQFGENGGPWGNWLPYSRPTLLSLSPGEGSKTVFARFRDAAGNVSDPVRAVTKVVPAEAPSEERPEVQDIGLDRVTPTDGGYEGFLTLQAKGMREMEITVDGKVQVSRELYHSRRLIKVSGVEGVHTVAVALWDDMDKRHEAKVVFQEDTIIPQEIKPPEPEKPDPTPYFTRLSFGGWMTGLEFNSLTPQGTREIDPGTAAAIQVAGGVEVLGPLYVDALLEYAAEDDVTFLNAGAGLGAVVIDTSVADLRTEVDVFAGVLYSRLDITKSDFGDFDPGVGYRVGAGWAGSITDRLSFRVQGEYRAVNYDYDGRVLTGDSDADASGWALLVGLNYGF